MTGVQTCALPISVYWSVSISSSGVANLYWYDGAGKTATGSTTLALNTWYHLAFVVTAGVVKIYVNGVAETLTGTTTLTSPNATSGNIVIGVDRANYYQGYISDLRAVRGIALYTSNFFPPTSPAIPNLTYTNSNYLNGNVITVNASSNVTANSVIQSSLLLSGSNGGIIDQGRNINIQSVGTTYVTSANVPYSGISGLSSVYFNGTSGYLVTLGSTPANQETA